MTTPPQTNPDHLLRRPKKPVETPANGGNGLLVAGGVGTVLVAAAVAAFFVFGHGRGAASGQNSAASASNVVAPASQNLAISAPASSTLKHGPHKPGTAAKPAPNPTPVAVPSATPAATQTQAPAAATIAAPARAANASDAAHARHLAALARLAAQRRQGAAASIGGGLPSGSSAAAQAQSAQPAPTQAPAAPTPDAEPTPVYAPSVVVDARFVDRVSPTYPEVAREQGASGTAIVLATVGPKGNVLSVGLDQSTGNKLLDAAALSAARSSRFSPPEIDGKPATETYRIVYSFDPNN